MTTLGQFISGYTDPSLGGAFAVAHAVLLLALVRALFVLIQEWRSIRAWEPPLHTAQQEARPRGHSACSRVFSEFCRDNYELAPKGILVPLTDYTDRVDSIVEGLVGRLHDLAGLFLVVGIAGTIWSFFSVASGGGDSTQLLMDGLRTAFPVAFMGLLWYFITYLLGLIPEDWLRRAAAQATEKALKGRRSVARSQAAMVEEALAPLKQLEQTLTAAVQPVVETFGRRLDQAHETARKQVETLTDAVKHVQASILEVRRAVDSLIATSEKAANLLSDAPAVLKDLERLQGEHSKWIASIQELANAVRTSFVTTHEHWLHILDSVKSLSGEFEQLPGHVAASTDAALTQVAAHVPTIFERGSSQLQERILGVGRDLEQSVSRASGSMEAASSRWRDLAEGSYKILQESIGQGIEALRHAAGQHMPTLEEVFSTRFPDTVGRFEDLDGRLRLLGQSLSTLHTEFTALFQRFDQAVRGYASAESIERIVAALTRLEPQLRDLVSTSRSLTRNLERVSSATASLDRRSRAWYPFDSLVDWMRGRSRKRS